MSADRRAVPGSQYSAGGLGRSGPRSAPDLLVLHTVRIRGMADQDSIVRRTGLPAAEVSDCLLDDQASGLLTRVDFAGHGGWALTDRGRDEDGRRLRDELEGSGAGPIVVAAHQRFESVNGRLVRACTDWQLRPTAADRWAENDHADAPWDDRILDELDELAAELTDLVADLSAALARFGGYDRRFAEALQRARAGDWQAVAGIGADSCHGVWMELHEDLLSTLGVPRGSIGGDR